MVAPKIVIPQSCENNKQTSCLFRPYSPRKYIKPITESTSILSTGFKWGYFPFCKVSGGISPIEASIHLLVCDTMMSSISSVKNSWKAGSSFSIPFDLADKPGLLEITSLEL